MKSETNCGEKIVPWIESHTELERHRKVILMAAELNIKPVYLSGHLQALWHNALEQQEDGDLSKWPNTLIAKMAMYDDDPDLLVSLLIKHHWIEPETRLLHDWLDYVGDFLIFKYGRRHRDKLVDIWNRHGKHYGNFTGQTPDMSSECPAQPTQWLVGSSSLHPKRRGAGETSGKGKPEYGFAFERFWKLIGGVGSKEMAWRSWQKLLDLQEEIMAGVQREIEWRKKAEDYKSMVDPKFFIPNKKHAVTWLNQKCWTQGFAPIPEIKSGEHHGTGTSSGTGAANRVIPSPGKYAKFD